MLLKTLAAAFSATFVITPVLFLLRIYAVFLGHPVVVGFFVFCWLGVVGSSITIPFSLSGAQIGPTDHCVDTDAKPFSSAGIIASTAFDPLVFIFISWRLLDNAVTGNSIREKVKAFFGLGGGVLPALSKALLSSGQVYYL